MHPWPRLPQRENISIVKLFAHIFELSFCEYQNCFKKPMRKIAWCIFNTKTKQKIKNFYFTIDITIDSKIEIIYHLHDALSENALPENASCR